MLPHITNQSLKYYLYTSLDIGKRNNIPTILCLLFIYFLPRPVRRFYIITQCVAQYVNADIETSFTTLRMLNELCILFDSIRKPLVATCSLLMGSNLNYEKPRAGAEVARNENKHKIVGATSTICLSSVLSVTRGERGAGLCPIPRLISH